MTAFEFGFALLSLLLGLGFAVIADNLAKLILAGRQVRWDWLAPIVAVNAFQNGMVYWWFQWSLRDQPLILADLSARAIACLVIYVLSVAALPQPATQHVDLRDHYERSRRLVNGSFLLYMALVAYALPFLAGRGFDTEWAMPLLMALVAGGIVIRNRWYQTAVQLLILLLTSIFWMGQSIRG